METNLSDFFERKDDKSEIEAHCRLKFLESSIDIYKIIQAARNETVNFARSVSSHYIQRNTMPEKMYSTMVGMLYDAYPNMMFKDKEGCPYLKLADNIRLYPKKLNDRYLPGNIVTDYVKEKRGQEMFVDDTHIHVLYVGPVLENNDWALDLKGVFASYINKYYPTKAAFIIDLKEFIKTIIVPAEETIQEEQLAKPISNDEAAKAK